MSTKTNAILHELAEQPNLTTAEIAARIGEDDEKRVGGLISHLVRVKGYVESIHKRGHANLWSLTDAGYMARLEAANTPGEEAAPAPAVTRHLAAERPAEAAAPSKAKRGARKPSKAAAPLPTGIPPAAAEALSLDLNLQAPLAPVEPIRVNAVQPTDDAISVGILDDGQLIIVQGEKAVRFSADITRRITQALGATLAREAA